MSTAIVSAEITSEIDVAPVSAEIKKFEATLPEPLVQEIHAFRVEWNKNQTRSVKSAYRLGQMVARVRDNENNKYGDKSVEKFAQATGVNATRLYALATFASSISEEELKTALHDPETDSPRLAANGKPLTASQLIEICKVEDKEKIPEMIEDAYKSSNASVATLKARVDAAGKQNTRSGGRKPSNEKDPAVLVYKLTKRLSNFQNFVLENTDNIDELANIDEDDASDVLYERMEELQSLCVDADATFKLLMTALKAGMKAVTAQLKAARSAAEVQDDEDEEETPAPRSSRSKAAKPSRPSSRGSAAGKEAKPVRSGKTAKATRRR